MKIRIVHDEDLVFWQFFPQCLFKLALEQKCHSSSRHTCREQSIYPHIAPQQAQFWHDACRWCEYWLVFLVYCVHIGDTFASGFRFHRYIRAFLWECLYFFSKYASTCLRLALCKTYSFFSRNLSFRSRVSTADWQQPKTPAVAVRSYLDGLPHIAIKPVLPLSFQNWLSCNAML